MFKAFKGYVLKGRFKHAGLKGSFYRAGVKGTNEGRFQSAGFGAGLNGRFEQHV